MSREGADARLGRLLAIVPWIAAHDGPTVEEVSRRFGVAEKELLADLNLLFMCGVYPFTPDVLIDVNIADGRVWINMADWFRRPLRLNAQEALALEAAGRAFLGFPGADHHGPLATALEKLDDVLGLERGDSLEVALTEVEPGLLQTLQAAVVDREKVRIGYYSFGRDQHTERVVHPWRVFNTAGEWYLAGWCERVDAERLFRLDRITGIELTGDHFEAPAAAGAGPSRPGSAGVYHPAPEDPLWVLDLDPPAHWVAEQYPNESVEALDGGVLRVRLRAGQRAWMERLLLRAGPHARVVEGEAGWAADVARRLLGRYRGAPA